MIYGTSQDPILADFITNQFGRLSLTFVKPTVIVLDNARVHTAAQVKEQSVCWQQRGLFLFYLPPYSPHLNIAERLWKELKI